MSSGLTAFNLQSDTDASHYMQADTDGGSNNGFGAVWDLLFDPEAQPTVYASPTDHPAVRTSQKYV